MIYQECSKEGGAIKNTGATEQCLEGLTIRTAVAPLGFSFPTKTAAKTKALWDAAIARKEIFPLYNVEEMASANTEDTFLEGRNQQYRTAFGKKVNTYTSFLGLCSHAALKSFNNRTMQLFEFTEDGKIIAINDFDNIKVKGQTVSLTVGKRLPATADRPPSTMVTINYKNFNELEERGCILYPEGWGGMDLYGIFDVNIIQTSASATSIKFQVTDGCAGGGQNLDLFEATDVIVRDLTGSVQTVTFVAADPQGIYEVVGTGFANGFTVELNGVVTKVDTSYESVAKLIVSGI